MTKNTSCLCGIVLLWCLFLATACSDSSDDVSDYLKPGATSELYFNQGIQWKSAPQSTSVSFETGRDWKATVTGTETHVDWCKVNPSSGQAGEAVVVISAVQNETTAERTATVTFFTGDIQRKILVSQAAKDQKPVVVPNGLSFTPEKPDADQPLTITFKADSKSELNGYQGEVYLYAGVICEGDWMFQPKEWIQNIDKYKMKALAANTWSIDLTPTIRDWFGSGETAVTKLGIVIRSADGNKKGIKEDSFVPVTDSKYQAFEPAAIKEAAMPAGVQEGINVLSPSSVTLVLYDADLNGNHKDYAHVVGDFNNWKLSNDENCQMYRDNAQKCWWITLNGLDGSKEYAFQYYVGKKGQESIRLADAYAEKILDPDNDPYIASSYNGNLTYPQGGRGIVSVFRTQPEVYNWKVNDFELKHADGLVIYEILLRDFTSKGNLNGAMEKLDYLKAMGVNAIEVMPVQEFDGNDSWGYNPSFFFAMDKAYGSKKMYKQFIDACHERGMAVILDVVYNHATGNHPFARLYWNGKDNKTAANNPWFNVDAPHPYSVFHDFNHESPLVRKFIKRNLQFLLKEYHVDGFRFDLTKGFTQHKSTESTAANYDASRVDILTDYYKAITEVKKDAFVVLEHFCVNNEERELANVGLHLWRNCNNAYCQSAMGWSDNSSFTALYEKQPAWVGFMESHDEERAAYKQKTWGNYDLKENLQSRMKLLEVNASFFLTVPGPKMIWQFGEMGYDVSIEDNGRTGKKPLHWEYLEDKDRKHLQTVYTNLMTLRNQHPELFDAHAALTWKVGTANWANGRTMYLKSVTGKQLVVLGNWTNVDVTVDFPAEAGDWTNHETGKTEKVENKMKLAPFSYQIYTRL